MNRNKHNRANKHKDTKNQNQNQNQNQKFTYRFFGKMQLIGPTFKLMELALERNPNWKKTTDQNQNYHYSNQKSKLSTFAKTNDMIKGKVFLSKLLKGKSYIPETHTIINGKICCTQSFRKFEKLDTQSFREFEKLDTQSFRKFEKPNTKFTKFYLKEDMNYGGKGIKIINNPLKYHTQIKQNSNYVLQRGVNDLLLYQGRKFDLRVWVYLIYRKSTIDVYIHKRSGYIRIAVPKYDHTSKNLNINLTNNSWGDRIFVNHHNQNQNQLYLNDTWDSQDFYQTTFQQVVKIVAEVFGKLEKYFGKQQSKGFEIMGFDFLVDKNHKVWLLEINRHLGYPIKNLPGYNPKVRENAIHITGEMVHLFLEPILLDKPYRLSENANHNWKKLISFQK